MLRYPLGYSMVFELWKYRFDSQVGASDINLQGNRKTESTCSIHMIHTVIDTRYNTVCMVFVHSPVRICIFNTMCTPKRGTCTYRLIHHVMYSPDFLYLYHCGRSQSIIPTRNNINVHKRCT